MLELRTEMKKRFLSVALAVVMMTVCLVGCGSAVHTEGDDGSSMFVCVETTNYWMIVYHKETKVMYAVNKNISNNAGCGVFSPLYNADGTLQIYEGDKIK